MFDVSIDASSVSKNRLPELQHLHSNKTNRLFPADSSSPRGECLPFNSLRFLAARTVARGRILEIHSEVSTDFCN